MSRYCSAALHLEEVVASLVFGCGRAILGKVEAGRLDLCAKIMLNRKYAWQGNKPGSNSTNDVPLREDKDDD